MRSRAADAMLRRPRKLDGRSSVQRMLRMTARSSGSMSARNERSSIVAKDASTSSGAGESRTPSAPSASPLPPPTSARDADRIGGARISAAIWFRSSSSCGAAPASRATCRA